jgi:hypothetical protein
MLNTPTTKANILVLLVCCILSVAICAPAFNRLFSSDDYCTIDHLVNKRSLLVPGFFRPVGDFTLWLTYKISGLRPFYFYLTNALLHGINAWLVYLLCLRVVRISNSASNVRLALIAAVLFLFYHSVGEVVFWAIGRGISLAITFSLLAGIVFFANIKKSLRYIFAPCLYLTALCAYESVLMLPLILIASIIYFRLKENVVIWLALFAMAAGANIALRVYFTGKLWAPYSGVVFGKSVFAYIESLIKSLARVIVPPVDAPIIFVLTVMVLSAVLISAVYMVWKINSSQRRLLGWGITSIFFAIVPAMFYGASTRTSEGDRFLYFPAIFLCFLTALLLCNINRAVVRNVAVLTMSLLGVVAISRTRHNWVEADRQVQTVVSQLSAHPERPLYIANLPGDFKGAFQFRNCFDLILRYNGVGHPEQVFKISGGFPGAAEIKNTVYWDGQRLEFGR